MALSRYIWMTTSIPKQHFSYQTNTDKKRCVRSCKFSIDSTRVKIFSLGNNTWLVYSIRTIATNHVCPKAGNLSPLMIKSGQSVTVKPGCHIPTMDHLITVDESEDMEIVTSWLDWTMTLSQLFNHHNNEQLTALITDI
jgi:hypothetical protein